MNWLFDDIGVSWLELFGIFAIGLLLGRLTLGAEGQRQEQARPAQVSTQKRSENWLSSQGSEAKPEVATQMHHMPAAPLLILCILLVSAAVAAGIVYYYQVKSSRVARMPLDEIVAQAKRPKDGSRMPGYEQPEPRSATGKDMSRIATEPTSMTTGKRDAEPVPRPVP